MKLREVGRVRIGVDINSDDVIESIRNPVILHSITQLVSMVTRKPYLIVASNPEVSQLVTLIVDRHWTKLVLYAAQSLIWGHAPVEVVWKLSDIYLPNGRIIRAAVVPDQLVFVAPFKVRYLADEESGKVVGFRIRDKAKKEVDILNEKALIFAHWPELVDSPYGLPVVALTKPFEEMLRDILELLGVWVENQASPPLIGRAPLQEVSLPDGRRMSAVEYMGQKLLELRANGATVVPSEIEQGGQPLWSIDAPIKISDSGTIAQAIEILLQLTRIGILGMGGTTVAGHSAQAIPAEDLVATHFFHEIMNALNDRLIHYLVYLNWGEGEWASMVSAESGSVDIELIRDLVRSSIQFFPEAREKLFQAVDWDALFDMLGMPTTAKKEPSDLERAVQAAVEPSIRAQQPQLGALQANPLAGLLGGLAQAPTPPQEGEEELDVEELLQKAGLRSGTGTASGGEGSQSKEG